jgi:hypothetical protein
LENKRNQFSLRSRGGKAGEGSERKMRCGEKKKKEKRGELALIAMDVQSRGQRMEGGRRACV